MALSSFQPVRIVVAWQYVLRHWLSFRHCRIDSQACCAFAPAAIATDLLALAGEGRVAEHARGHRRSRRRWRRGRRRGRRRESDRERRAEQRQGHESHHRCPGTIPECLFIAASSSPPGRAAASRRDRVNLPSCLASWRSISGRSASGWRPRTPRPASRRRARPCAASSDDAALEALERFCGREEIGLVLFGTPRSPEGVESPFAARIRSFAAKLAARTGLPIRFHEETLTSDEASRRLPRPAAREELDAMAAAVLLEDYLQSGSRRALSATRERGERAPGSRGARVLRLGLLLVFLALAAGVYLYQQLEYPHAAEPGSEITLFFPLGTPTAEIFRRLASEGVLAFPRFAEAYYRVARSATPLQAGEYRFERPTPLSRVIDRMSRGDVVQHVIVVPEGLTAEETFELFWSRGISRPLAFRNAFHNPQLIASIGGSAPDLEGFLFPDTYSVTRSTSARQIVETMLANFRKHFTAELRERAHANGLSPRDAVTLASIVQKETALPREEAIIAGIYWNRLRRGMRLQADPTVAYALQLAGQWTGTLYRSDYGFESDFNTYLHAGLPPGPICNPGLRRAQGRERRPRRPTSSTSSRTERVATASPGRSRSTATRSRPADASATSPRARTRARASAGGRPRPEPDAVAALFLTRSGRQRHNRSAPPMTTETSASPARPVPADGGARRGRARPRVPAPCGLATAASSVSGSWTRPSSRRTRSSTRSRRTARSTSSSRTRPSRAASRWTPPTASRTSPGTRPTGERSRTLCSSAATSARKIPVEHALLIAEKIATALDHAYNTTIDGDRTLHGLVWPGFVAISDDGEIRLAGFGLAPGVLPSLARPRLTTRDRALPGAGGAASGSHRRRTPTSTPWA